MPAKKRESSASKGATSKPVKSGRAAKPGNSPKPDKSFNTVKIAKSAKPATPGRVAQLEAMVDKLRAGLEAWRAADGRKREIESWFWESLTVPWENPWPQDSPSHQRWELPPPG